MSHPYSGAASYIYANGVRSVPWLYSLRINCKLCSARHRAMNPLSCRMHMGTRTKMHNGSQLHLQHPFLNLSQLSVALNWYLKSPINGFASSITIQRIPLLHLWPTSNLINSRYLVPLLTGRAPWTPLARRRNPHHLCTNPLWWSLIHQAKMS